MSVVEVVENPKKRKRRRMTAKQRKYFGKRRKTTKRRLKKTARTGNWPSGLSMGRNEKKDKG